MAKSVPFEPRGCGSRSSWSRLFVILLAASTVAALRQPAFAETGFASVKICPARASDGDQITCRIVSQNVSTTDGGDEFGVQQILVENSFSQITLIPQSVTPTCSACTGTDMKCTSDGACGGAPGSCEERCTTDAIQCYRVNEENCGNLAACTANLAMPLTNGSIAVEAGDGNPGGPDTFMCLITETVYGLGACGVDGIPVVDTVTYEGVGAAGSPGEGLTATDVRPATVLINCCGDHAVNAPGEFCDTGLTGEVPDPIASECPNPNPFVNGGVNDLGCVPGVDQECRSPGTPGECTICGDGLVQDGLESCDRTDFAAGGASLPARGDCRVTGAAACTYCGDGAVQEGTGETCDDGVLAGVGNDGSCRGGDLRCTVCGDGVLQAPLEKCDAGPDGPFSAPGAGVGDPHDGLCRRPSDYPNDGCTACGDGVWQSDIEECDPSDPSGPANCRSDCTMECITDGDCDDGNVCTTDLCVDNKCESTAIPGCIPCVTDGECDDGNVCTTDLCVDDKCESTAIPGCIPCVTDGDCDDGNVCTTDLCVDDKCQSTAIPGCIPCVTDGDCDDGNACTTDLCVDDKCQSTAIPGCIPCTTDGECNDGDACTTDRCVDDKCESTTIPGCTPCVTDGECNDGDPCTTDLCVDDRCVSSMIPGCVPCVTDEECGDGDVCTVDVCIDDVCVHRPSFLAKVRGQIGNASEINGHFGVNDAGGQVRFGRDVFVADGATTSGDIIRIGNGSSIDDVFGNVIRLGNGVVVRGIQGVPVLPLVEPFCPVPDFQCGTMALSINSDVTMAPLNPGVYGDVRVFNGATLRLKPGTFTFCQIRTGRRAAIITSGATTINVTGKVRIANGSVFVPDAGSPTPVLNVLGSQIRVGAQSVLQAHLSAPGALLTMGRQSEFRGTFCVYRTRSDKRTVLECPPDERPASPSGAFVDVAQ